MGSVSFAVAYAGGLLTLFAPCSALLVPSFFAYAFSSKARLASRTLIFFLGLLVGLLPLGLALGSLGAVLVDAMRSLTFWGGIIIAAFGLWQVLALPVPSFASIRHRRRKRQLRNQGLNLANGDVQEKDHTSPVAIFLLGLTYGLASTGCSGPILGAIAAFAVTGGSALTGMFIMFAFACGMFTPVAVLAFLWDKIPSRMLSPKPITVFGRPSSVGNLVAGLIFMVLGAVVAIFGGGKLSTSLLSASRQVALERRAQEMFSGMPNWLFAVLVVLILAYIFVYYWGKRPRKTKPETGLAGDNVSHVPIPSSDPKQSEEEDADSFPETT